MTLVKLAVCTLGIYGSFLSWALVQERLTTKPYAASHGGDPARFNSPIFLNTVQSLFCTVAAILYMYAWKRRSQTVWDLIGLPVGLPPPPSDRRELRTRGKAYSKRPGGYLNGEANGDAGYRAHTSELRSPSQFAFFPESPWPLLWKYAQCAMFQAAGGPFGFASLRHISYPTMILGKSCKLVPVMLMNIVLYRRKFAAHKYVVVAMVTAGISVFMLAGPQKKRKEGAEHSSVLGLALLTINLLLDGAVNSTQDEVFARYKKVTGAQMMFWMNAISTVMTIVTLLVPLPPIPYVSAAGTETGSELWDALAFIAAHPGVVNDIVLYSLCGASGQLFIFSTLSSFGSLTLVTITVTRKLFTMLLSVVVYDHSLSLGQWAGVGLVFAGIGVEAGVKAGEKHGGKEKIKRVLEGEDVSRVKDI